MKNVALEIMKRAHGKDESKCHTQRFTENYLQGNIFNKRKI